MRVLLFFLFFCFFSFCWLAFVASAIFRGDERINHAAVSRFCLCTLALVLFVAAAPNSFTSLAGVELQAASCGDDAIYFYFVSIKTFWDLTGGNC